MHCHCSAPGCCRCVGCSGHQHPSPQQADHHRSPGGGGHHKPVPAGSIDRWKRHRGDWRGLHLHPGQFHGESLTFRLTTQVLHFASQTCFLSTLLFFTVYPCRVFWLRWCLSGRTVARGTRGWAVSRPSAHNAERGPQHCWLASARRTQPGIQSPGWEHTKKLNVWSNT